METPVSGFSSIAEGKGDDEHPSFAALRTPQLESPSQFGDSAPMSVGKTPAKVKGRGLGRPAGWGRSSGGGGGGGGSSKRRPLAAGYVRAQAQVLLDTKLFLKDYGGLELLEGASEGEVMRLELKGLRCTY